MTRAPKFQWTPAHDAVLRGLWGKRPASRIADALDHPRGGPAVIARARRLGLPAIPPAVKNRWKSCYGRALPVEGSR